MNPVTIKRARRDAKLTQAQMAALLGVSTATVKSWESGRRNMPASTWELFTLKSEIKR